MMYHVYIMQTTTLARTQIYLTQTQQKRLAAACRRTAATKSELIRQAVDQFLDQQTTAPRSDKLARVQGIAGLWADRNDIADPAAYVRTLRAPRF
jgi:Ribbon-helix-helix protein, copG family